MNLETQHPKRVWNEYLGRWQGGPHPPSQMAGTRISPSAWVADCVTIGRNCRIGPNVSIGWEGFGYEKETVCATCPHDTTCPPCHGKREWLPRQHLFGVVIGDNVDIGAGTVIDRGRYRDTVIGAGTKIDANVFIAHNCLIGERCLIVANSQISGSCEISDDCHIGPAAMLTDHVKVGTGGRCGLGAVVLRDVPARVTVVGSPARDIEERRARTREHGSHGGIPDGFGDGSDEFSLPVARPDFSELGQRQRAAERGWMGAVKGARGR